MNMMLWYVKDYFEPVIPKKKWLIVIGWMLYSMLGVCVSFIALIAGFWAGFACAVAFIFGPKLWRHIGESR